MSTATVSMRGKPTDMPITTWLEQYRRYQPLEVTGVFGFTKEFSPLYGGREFIGEEITKEDLDFTIEHGLKLKIPLTANKATEEEYLVSRYLLNKYYYPGNTIAVVDDNLARWIKRDYPRYTLEASVIKNVKWENIEETLELYDTLVLTMDKNDDFEKLSAIKEKDRVILFGNAGCAYNCPSKICYSSVSKINKGVPDAQILCSQGLKPREATTVHDFDLDKLRAIGFSNFKFVSVGKGFGF